MSRVVRFKEIGANIAECCCCVPQRDLVLVKLIMLKVLGILSTTYK